ncbi:MAG: DMT family transporter [Ardenticatenia bacterium]|nr:DMT family transporter [Ardenticatenia bacterium]
MSAPRPQPAKRPPFPPILALISGILAVSTGAIFVRLADEAPPLVVAAYRVGIASALLAPLAWWRARHELRALGRRDSVLAVLAGFFLALHFATWVSSLYYTSVASSVVLVNTNPLWVGLLAPVVSRERITRLMAAGILLSVVGGIIIGLGDLAISGQALWGDILAIMGSISAAFYILLGRNVRRQVSLLAYVMVCYGSAALILWAIVLVTGQPITGYAPSTYAIFLGMAVVPQIIGHSSYNWALEWVSASMVAVGLLGEPIGSTILAYILFGERLTWAKVVGGGFILAGIYLTARGEAKSVEHSPEVFEPTG